MENNPSPLLSVCLITYNHGNYIKQAIEGVLMQITNFTWEFIIADDCSIDGTREIVVEYQKKYPNLIKLILQNKNVGAAQNWLDLINASKSKYIAYLEGDDYWVDPLKSQKQVDVFLKHPDTIICGARAKTWNERKKQYTTITPALEKNISCMTPEQFFYLGDWVKSCTRLVIRDLMISIPISYGMDYRQVHYLLAKTPTGTFRCLDEVVAVYREHAGGVFSGADPIDVQKEYFESTTLIAKLFEDERANRMRKRALQTAKELYLNSSLELRVRVFFALQYFVLTLKNISHPEMKQVLNQLLSHLSVYLDRYPAFKAFLRTFYRFFKRTGKGDIQS
jgi:glycosyltransferase involved in cell wall biosynthesis